MFFKRERPETDGLAKKISGCGEKITFIIQYFKKSNIFY